LDYAKAHLAPNGHLGLIAPAEQTDEIIFNAELKGLKLRRMCDICAREGRQAGRTMFDFALADGDTHSETLHIRQSDGALHPLYTAIVEPFYTKIS
jgi:tRNA1(Val) A37 N6-methylase TrmN6